MFVTLTYAMQVASGLAFGAATFLLMRSYRKHYTKTMWINGGLALINAGIFGVQFLLRAKWATIG